MKPALTFWNKYNKELQFSTTSLLPFYIFQTAHHFQKKTIISDQTK
ncbi:hypothetical protein CHCC20333_2416 [Bacillus paralicheniformis]|nr:hypothetical protein CHCC5027_0660 [Bacillus paralicheniformis]TWK91298.1 hypothetical protein CHCC20333_2416 [Bacillus paralicheniformis]